jgi:hypothetical protein
MSQKETTDLIGHLEVHDSPNGNLSNLADLARQAYDQKRTKECLDLTRAMLLIDPDNAEAQSMRSAIQSELHRDLENARAFFRQAHAKETSEKQQQSNDSPVPESQPDAEGEDLEALAPETDPLPEVSADSSGKRQTRWLMRAAVLLGFGVLAAGLPMLRTKSNTTQPSPSTLSASDISKPIVNLNAVPPDPWFRTHSAEVTAPAAAPPPAATPTPASTSAAANQTETAGRSPDLPPVPRAAAKLPDPPVAAANGILAVSSPTSVDIYKDDAYIGSAPVSLELPPGRLTLEYRHGNLRKTVTHVINSSETTRSMITFDVSVQINSRPWAEVFMDGVERKALGQTPLSGVRVPIGSVLIFENPQFPPKRYRVTGNETGIQIVFP